MKEKNIDLFEKAPIPEVVLRNIIPAIISMLMVLVYNLADTFFIGQTGDPFQVAAVSLATPVFLLLLAFGNLFGIGGTSVISRALGEKKKDYAKKTSSFCFWACVAVGAASMLLAWAFMDTILSFIGTSPDTINYTRSYLSIVAYSSVFVLISNCFSNIIRAEGKANEAMMGMLIGNLINVILDPIMILGLDWGIAGAAIATVIGNIAGALYYILYYLRGKSILSINIKDFSVKNKICTSVLAIGIPASLGSLLMSVSNIFVNNFIVEYGDMAVAGIGVAMKVTMIAALLVLGLGQGVQPILGYCFGAKKWERYNGVLRFSLLLATILSVILTIICYIGADYIVNSFLDDPAAHEYGVQFSHMLLISAPCLGVLFVFINAIQAVGAATPSLILSVTRQGLIYIPLLFILNNIAGLHGLVYAQPIADYLSCFLATIIYVYTRKKVIIPKLSISTKDSKLSL